MIGIQLEGYTEFLELFPETSINLRLENPILSDPEKISPGSYSLPFELPCGDHCPTNAVQLKNPDVIENSESYNIQKATLFVENIPFKKGNLKPQSTTKDKISTYFTFGLNSISPEFKTKKLRDLVDEEFIISTRTISRTIYLKPIQTITPVDISVNEGSYSGEMADVVADINVAAIGQTDTDKFVPIAELVVTGTSPSGLIPSPFIKLHLAKVTTAVPGPGYDYEDSINPLDELSIKIANTEQINQNDYLIESFSLDDYYDDFDTFFNGYINGSYPTDKFRMPAFLNNDPYGALGKLEPGESGGVSSVSASGLVLAPTTIKTGNLINGVNASGIIRNTANAVVDFLLTISAWNIATAYTRVRSWVKHPDSNGDIRYWFCMFTGSGHEPPTDPITNFSLYWTRCPLRYENDNRNNNSIQPFLRRKWILEKIAATFGFYLEGDFFEHPDLENMLEYTSTALDVPQDYLLDKKFVFWRRAFNLKELVPDITVIEYLRRLQKRYNLGIYFNENTKKVRLTLMEPLSKSNTYDDITSLSSPIISSEDQRVTGYSINCPKDDTDGLSEIDNVNVGIVEEVIPMLLGGIKHKGIQVVDGNSISAPLVKQNFGAQYLMRTFYYTGINTTGPFNYPSADIRGTIINEHLATEVDDIGIYEMFWKYWLVHQRNRLGVTLNVGFPLRKLLNFDWELKRRFDRTNYLVKSIDVQITTNGIKVTKTELYTMK